MELAVNWPFPILIPSAILSSTRIRQIRRILLFEGRRFRNERIFRFSLGGKESRESGNILEFEGGLYTFFRGLHVFANGILIDAEQLGEGGGSPRFSPPPRRCSSPEHSSSRIRLVSPRVFYESYEFTCRPSFAAT